MKLISVAMLAALCAGSAGGQVRAGGGAGQIILKVPITGGSGAGRRGALIGLSGPPLRDHLRRHDFARNSFWYGGWPYWPSDYEDSYQPETASHPPQAASAPVTPPNPAPGLEPALYELRGSHWIRLTFGEASASSSAPPAPMPPSTVLNDLPPAVLVYRDGHTEEVSSYSIIGVTLYTKADYYASGEWTRKIQIADLDLPATVKQNHERGLRFDLPTGPNEVILRP